MMGSVNRFEMAQSGVDRRPRAAMTVPHRAAVSAVVLGRRFTPAV